MSRTERIGECTLMLGDALDLLPTLPKHDACVTDPPYGIGWDRQAERDSDRKPGTALAAKRAYQASGWDDAIPSAELLTLVRCAGQHQIIFGGNYFDLPPARCWLVWDKQVNGAFADCELAWTNLDKPVRKISWMWNGMLRQGNEVRNEHPTQKPLGVMKWALGHLPASQSIIDPFMGSGTTGVACAALGIKFTGIEREPRYFDIACRRVEEAYRQPRLFTEPRVSPKQEVML